MSSEVVTNGRVCRIKTGTSWLMMDSTHVLITTPDQNLATQFTVEFAQFATGALRPGGTFLLSYTDANGQVRRLTGLPTGFGLSHEYTLDNVNDTKVYGRLPSGSSVHRAFGVFVASFEDATKTDEIELGAPVKLQMEKLKVRYHLDAATLSNTPSTFSFH